MPACISPPSLARNSRHVTSRLALSRRFRSIKSVSQFQPRVAPGTRLVSVSANYFPPGLLRIGCFWPRAHCHARIGLPRYGLVTVPVSFFLFFHFLNKKKEKKIDLRLADTCALLLVASYSPETGNRSRLIHFSRAEKGNENKRSK